MINPIDRHRERMKQSKFIIATHTKSISGKGSKKEIRSEVLTALNHKSSAPIPKKKGT